METTHSIRTALQPGEWTFQIDIMDAYLHIPVHRDFRKYLRFTVGTEVYQFKTLPFGLSVAPKIFTETLRPVLGLLRSRGIKIHAYLDDWLGRALSQRLANHHGTEVIQLLTHLGWVVNWEKTDISGTQTPIFLGLRFRLDLGRVKPGPKAWKSITETIRNLRPGITITARRMASLIGMLKHWAPYIIRGRLSLRSLQHWISNRWQQSHARWNARITLDQEFTSQLTWWTRPERTGGVPLHPPTPSQDLYTDASTTGWGGSLGTSQASGTWTAEESGLHINQLEMLAVLYAGQQLREHLTRRITRVHIDNSTTVAHLRKEGGTRSWPLTRLTSRVLKWCDKHRVILVPVHIAGIRNILADSLSRRGQLQGSEWALSPHEVDRIFNQTGWPSTDLMATAANRVVKQFISPIPHPDALGVDVFATRWPEGTLYLFPSNSDGPQDVTANQRETTPPLTPSSVDVPGPNILPGPPGPFIIGTPTGRQIQGITVAASSRTLTHYFSHPAGTVQPGPVGNLPPASSNRLDAITNILRAKGVAEPVIRLAARPQRNSTAHTYSGQWENFVSFCRGKNWKPFGVSESDLAEYLLSIFDKGCMPSTVKVHRAAVLSVLKHVNPTLTESTLIGDLMSRLEIERPRPFVDHTGSDTKIPLTLLVIKQRSSWP